MRTIRNRQDNSAGRRLTRRRSALAALVTLLATALLPLTASSASAVQGDLTCSGNFEFNFTPPLRNPGDHADAVVGGGLVNCTSPNGRYPDLHFGVRVGLGDATASSQSFNPCQPAMTVTENAVLLWNTRQVSTFNITVTTGPAPSFNAVFTSGPLKGDTANATPILLNTNSDCATNGLSRFTSELLTVSWS